MLDEALGGPGPHLSAPACVCLVCLGTFLKGLRNRGGLIVALCHIMASMEEPHRAAQWTSQGRRQSARDWQRSWPFWSDGLVRTELASCT